jgi:hypothetical protein
MATASAGYVLLDTFAPEILQYCNGAPTIMVRSHVINTVIEFCEKSLVLKKSPSPLNLEEDVNTYTLKYPANRYRAIAVDNARIDGSDLPMTETTEKEMNASFANWRTTTASKPSRYFLEDETNKIRFWPMTNADINDDLELVTRVTYTRSQTEVDEFLYEKWHEVIQAGVINRMLMIPSATWYNPQLAQEFKRVWSRGIRQARKTTLTGTGEYPGRVIPQSYDIMGSNANRRTGSWV